MIELEKNLQNNREKMYDLISVSEDYSNSVMESKNMIFSRRESIMKNKETIQINRSKIIFNPKS